MTDLLTQHFLKAGMYCCCGLALQLLCALPLVFSANSTTWSGVWSNPLYRKHKFWAACGHHVGVCVEWTFTWVNMGERQFLQSFLACPLCLCATLFPESTSRFSDMADPIKVVLFITSPAGLFTCVHLLFHHNEEERCQITYKGDSYCYILLH